MTKYSRFRYDEDRGWTFTLSNGIVETKDSFPIECTLVGNSISYESCGERSLWGHGLVDPVLICSEWDFRIGKLCPIMINHKWGFIDCYLEIIVKPLYDLVGEYIEYQRACHRPLEYSHSVIWENGICKAIFNNSSLTLDINILMNRPNYRDNYNILLCDCKNTSDIINICHSHVPDKYKSMPWHHPELNHGVDLLASDEALNCYMSAYGEMHMGKCRAAMMNFPFEQLNGSIEIVDWGCGQGIGSATVIDVLKQHDLLQWLRRVTLIEPSEHALNRAMCNITKLTHSAVEIDTKNKYLPTNGTDTGDSLTAVGYTYANIIHIFSNILDVRAIDLAAVARMVASSHGKHFVLCMGPKNGAAFRIEQFCSVFGEQNYFSHIDSSRFARTVRTGHPYTCMTRCFTYNGSPLDLSRLSLFRDTGLEVFNDYDLRLQVQNGTMSEQKAEVAKKLQSFLSIDDIMYIDPIVNEVAVDFIVVRPNKGVLLVNVFEEDLHNCRLSQDKKDILVSGKSYQSPIDLINLCQISIKDGIEELLISTIEDSRNFGLIKKVVVFTNNKLDDVKAFFGVSEAHKNFTFLFGNEFIDNGRVSINLYDTIKFHYNNPAFDNVVKRKLAKIISPSWHSYQEGRIGIEPQGAQRNLVRSHRTQQKISGVAGAGKTFVLTKRAINAMKRTGGDVLVLTYNITLANYLRFRLSEIREDFSWEKIDIYPYHQFFRIRATECKLHVGFGSYDEVGFFANTNRHKKYSAIFVDEVQDYTTEWLRIIKNFLIEPNGEFVVFGDPKQNVYHRPLDANKDIRLGVIGGEWNRQLNTSRRFTNPRLASLATAFQNHFFTDLPTDNIATTTVVDNSFNFQIVSYYDMRTSYSLDTLVGKIIEIIESDQNGAQDFVVLASSTKLLRNIDFTYRQRTGQKTEVTFVATEPFERLKRIHAVTDEQTANWKFKRDFESVERTRKQLFTTDKRCLKISTIQSFKGWESPSVIVILEEDLYSSKSSFRPMAPETIYTAITRARENMHIINIGNDTYHDFFNSQAR